MDIFGDSEEEDNNPFTGTNHLYASGIAAVEDGEDDFIPKGPLEEEEEEEQMVLEGEEFAEQPSGEPLGALGEDVEPLGTAVSDITAPFEPFVSLTMSMATNNVSHGGSSEEDSVIQVVEAGEYRDPWGKRAIGYVLRFEGQEVVRRYSEFDTLRHALLRLLPTIVIPPIPSKHPLIRYFLSPLSAESDSKIIEKRKRLFSLFLKNCSSTPDIRDHIVFKKFLDPEYAWKNVLNSPPIVILPVNNLLAPPLNPTKPSPLHLLLPGPTSVARLDLSAHSGSSIETETQFAHLEAIFKRSKQTFSPLHRMVRQHRLHFHNLSSFFAELGAYYNAFSLEDNVIANDRSMLQIKSLASGIEKIGHGFDVNYVSSEILVDNILSVLEEPLGEMLQYLDDAHRVLQFRKLKQMQYQIIETTITRRENRVRNLQEAQHQLQRLEVVFQKNAQESPTIAEAIRRIETSLHEETPPPSEHSLQVETAPPSLHHPTPQPRLKRKTRKSRPFEMEPHLLTEAERQDEIQRLQKEVDKLQECFKVISKDINEVDHSSLNSLLHLSHLINAKWDSMLKNFTNSMIKWLSECLKAWKNARNIVDTIHA